MRRTSIASWLAAAIGAVTLMAAALPAFADDPNNPFNDVSPNDPAFAAIVRLHDDGYLQGYPDGYFHGSRPITRYEMAQLIDRVVGELEYQLKDPNGAMRVAQRDIAAAKLLLDTYGGQIKDLQTAVANHQSILDRTQIHLYYYQRAPGYYEENVKAFAPGGAPIPDGTVVSDGLQKYTVGHNKRGIGLNVTRLIFSGNFDKQTSYYIRLENKNFFGQQNVNGLNNTPFNNYNTQGFLRINQAYARYNFPNTPFYLVGGKYTVRAGPTGLNIDNDYYNGGLAGYNGKYWDAWVGYGQVGGPDLGSGNPFDYVPGPQPSAQPNTQFQVVAHMGGYVGKKLRVDSSLAQLQAYPHKVYNTSTGTFVSTNAPFATGSLGLSYIFTPWAQLQWEGLLRFGNDPVNGGAWKDNKAMWGVAYLGNNAPLANNNFAEVGFIGTGYASTLPEETFVNGTPFYTYNVSGQPNDRRLWYLGAHHWINSNVRVGLNYVTWGLNTPLPINVSGTALPPGSFIGTNQNNYLFANTLVQF